MQSLMVDSRGRLWCGTYSELGLVRYDTGSGEIVFSNQSNRLGSTRIRVAFELRDGTVAVGTQDGLALIRGDEVAAFYDKDNGLETQSILCIVQAPDGTPLAGSAGVGISALTYSGATDLCIGYQLVGFAKAKGLHRGQLAGGLDGKLCQNQTQTVHLQNQLGLLQEPHQAANWQHPAGRVDFFGFTAVLQAPVGRRPGRPHRGEKEAERVSTENRAEHPSDDRLGVQSRHAAHRAARGA